MFNLAAISKLSKVYPSEKIKVSNNLIRSEVTFPVRIDWALVHITLPLDLTNAKCQGDVGLLLKVPITISPFNCFFIFILRQYIKTA